MAHLGSRHHARAMTKCTSQSAAAASPTSPRTTRACACRPSRREFTKFGPISDVFLPKDRNTGEMRHSVGAPDLVNTQLQIYCETSGCIDT